MFRQRLRQAGRTVIARTTKWRLILFLLLALLLWKSGWLLLNEPRRRALARLEGCGCRVGDRLEPASEQTAPLDRLSYALGGSRWFPRFRYLLPVTRLECSQFNGDESAFANVAYLPEVRELNLRTSPANDATLVHVGALKQLERLWLDGTQITDKGILHLSGLSNLHTLDLCMTPIRGETLGQLSCAETLEWLRLDSNYEMTDEGILQLRYFRNLKELGLLAGDFESIDGHGFSALGELRKLQRVLLPEEYREHWEPYVSHIPDVNTW